jgi:histidine ammonia-lyase
MEHRRPLRGGAGVERAYGLVRERMPALEHDRPLGPDLEALAELVRSGALAGIATENQA